MITIRVKDDDQKITSLHIPEGINLNVMEVLKASGYPIAATCGGLALCATCHVRVLEGGGTLSDPTESELDMLDRLPNGGNSSRLSCQIKVEEKINNILLAIAHEDKDIRFD